MIPSYTGFYYSIVVQFAVHSYKAQATKQLFIYTSLIFPGVICWEVSEFQNFWFTRNLPTARFLEDTAQLNTTVIPPKYPLSDSCDTTRTDVLSQRAPFPVAPQEETDV